MKKFTFLSFFAFIAMLFLGSTAFGQITQRGATQTTTTTSTTITITKPAGLAVGDVMFANIIQGDDGNSQTLSNASLSGAEKWTFVRGGEIAVNGSNSWWGTVLYKVASPADVAATNFTFSLDADADAAVGGIIAFYNVDVTGGVGPSGTGSGPFDVAAGTFQVTGNSPTTTVTAPSITTNSANAAVIMFGMVSNNTTFSAWTTTSPGALTEILDINSNDNPDQGVGAAWAIKASAGATGNGTATTSSNRNGGLLVALKARTAALAYLTPSATQTIAAGGTVSFTAAALGFGGSGNYSYQWTAAGATIPAPNPASVAAATNAKTLTFPSAGTYTVSVAITRTGVGTVVSNTTTVTVVSAPATPFLFASSSNGSIISSYSVNLGIYFAGPTTVFTPTFPGTTTGATYTSAIGRTDKPSQALGHHYWIGNTSGNSGVVEIWGATSTGASPTRLGSVDMNGASTTSLGFVRLGMGPDGTGWILAGEGSNLYLAKFATNLLAAVSPVVEDASVDLVGGSASTFQNGDLCISGNGNIYALANDGSGVTQIFIGAPAGSSTTLTKKWDLVDNGGAPFTGSVNGVAFSPNGSLYITSANGLYYIDATTVNGPAGTVETSLIHSQTGLHDLSSNIFPTNSPLPVTLISFTGSLSRDVTNLNWVTENIQNFKHFEVERSSDGSNYTSIATKTPTGDLMSRATYTYSDNLASVSGVVFYYRLKMVDLDGGYKYSNVILVRKDSKAITGISINPNPVRSGAGTTVRFEATENATVNLNVIDMSGKIVLRQQNNVGEGTNSISLNNVDRLQPGTYILQMNDGKSVQSTRFVIAH